MPEPQKEYRPEDFEELYILDGETFVARVPTWIMNPKLPWEKIKLKFDKKPRQAARDYGNKPVVELEELFFQNFQILEDIANRSKLKHPFRVDESLELHSWYKPCCRIKHYIHGDLGAKRDALGIAMAHRCYKSKKVVVDLIVQCPIPLGSQLMLKTFRDFVVHLYTKGFWIGKVTTDSWQSLETHQLLQRKGFQTEVYSVDRNLEPWDTWWDLCVADDIDFYGYPKMMEEAAALRLIDGKKVDHTSQGSKDVCDGVAGAVAQCMLSSQGKSRASVIGI